MSGASHARTAARLPVERLDAVLFDLTHSGVFNGAARLAKQLRAIGMPTAIAVAECPPTGWERSVTVVVEGRGVALPPDPATVLDAAKRLGVHPSGVAVITDTVAGVQAARRAGCGFVLGLAQRDGPESLLRAYGTDVVLGDLDTLTVDDVAGCCGGGPSSARAPPRPQRGRARPLGRHHHPHVRTLHGEQIISQFDGYPGLAAFDLAGYRARYGNIGRLDLILAAEGDSTNRYQVSKQADVLMLFYLLSAEELRELLADLGYPWPGPALPRTIAYYFGRTTHGSTLSRIVHSWVQARTDRACSWDCFTQALAADIQDTQGGTTHTGIHLGAMAGTLDLAERCYLGLETRDDALWLNPRLPEQITRLATTLRYRGHSLHVTATHTKLTIAASPCDAAPLTIRAAAEVLRIAAGQTRTVPLTPADSPAATLATIAEAS
ncbi:glycosyl hydrolase family 65 protein [Prauserella muralis]|uniref:HAD superfamily hydrolase (TIGR01509 family) n=1 Tax=Prauserella muralis TaxID=588067 RepID=A0A2V4B1W8_9PSEU|nr:glycosyl hydrolase family 65 protein [Prauserella muralis]PXY28261.1 hypothetical protein BAY60_18255 [Prauserella muralis]